MNRFGDPSTQVDQNQEHTMGQYIWNGKIIIVWWCLEGEPLRIPAPMTFTFCALIL